MDCKLFDYTGENIIIDKKTGELLMNSENYASLTGILTAPLLQPYKALSDITGEIILAYNSTGFAANYVMINYGTDESPYTKNYFITGRELLEGGKMKFTLRCDVLTTFRSGVRSAPVVCRRTACGKQSKYIFDVNAPVQTKRRVDQNEEPTDMCKYSNNMILITVG